MALLKKMKTKITLFSVKKRNNESYHAGDIIFCKNNVCVHSNDNSDENVIHHPGYFTLSYDKRSSASDPHSLTSFTLWLTWVPNSALQKYLLEEHPLNMYNIKFSLIGEEYRKISTDSSDSVCSDCSSSILESNSIASGSNSSYYSDEVLIFENNRKCAQGENGCTEYASKRNSENSEQISQHDELCGTVNSSPHPPAPSNCELNTFIDESFENDDQNVDMYDINENIIQRENGDTKANNYDGADNMKSRYALDSQDIPNSCLSKIHSEREKLRRNSMTQFYRPNPCQQFSIDLRDMKSIRLFFTEKADGSGQLVISSKENQYKVLHFHCGGLKKVSEILRTLHAFKPTTIDSPMTKEDSFYEHFVVRQFKNNGVKFPETTERIPEITEDMWNSMLNESGQVKDQVNLRKAVFFGGINKSLRKTIWPFLLNYYNYNSTLEERCRHKENLKLEYEELCNRRKNLPEHITIGQLKNSKYVITKDVLRTDRMNPYYAEDKNPNIKKMKRILLNYTIYDSKHGYTQGMSDLLSPILAEIQDEVESFWCFVGLMKRSLFFCYPTDVGLRTHLEYLRELIRIMFPPFYEHLTLHSDRMELLFCHRWLLLCCKREFPEEVFLHMWEACWSNYLTGHFHLFICLAIIVLYSDEVLKNNYSADEMLYYFNSLSMYMDGPTILRQARSLLYAFRSLPEVPSTLAPLCQEYGSDIWDNRHVPIKEEA